MVCEKTSENYAMRGSPMLLRYDNLRVRCCSLCASTLRREPLMISVLSKFVVANDTTDKVKEAFLNRPHSVDQFPGFVRLEVLSPYDSPNEITKANEQTVRTHELPLSGPQPLDSWLRSVSKAVPLSDEALIQ